MSNLLTTSEKRRLKKDYQVRLVAATLSMLSMLVLFALAQLVPTLINAYSTRASLATTLNTLRGSKSFDHDEAEAILEATSEKLSVLKAKVNVPQNPSEYFSKVLEVATEEIEVTNLSFTTNRAEEIATFEFRGVAKDRTALASYVERLRNQPEFRDIELPIENFVKSTDIPFRLVVTINAS